MTPLEKLTRARDALDEILSNYQTATKRLRDARRGEPGSSFASGGGSGGRSPVESSLGLNGPGDPEGWHLPPDRAAATLDAVDRLVGRSCTDLETLRRTLAAEVPSAPTDKQRREVERANTPQMEECAVMRELAGVFEPAHCRTDLGGLLLVEQPVGRWVYDFARKNGRRPTKAEAIARANGQRVMVRA